LRASHSDPLISKLRRYPTDRADEARRIKPRSCRGRFLRTTVAPSPWSQSCGQHSGPRSEGELDGWLLDGISDRGRAKVRRQGTREGRNRSQAAWCIKIEEPTARHKWALIFCIVCHLPTPAKRTCRSGAPRTRPKLVPGSSTDAQGQATSRGGRVQGRRSGHLHEAHGAARDGDVGASPEDASGGDGVRERPGPVHRQPAPQVVEPRSHLHLTTAGIDIRPGEEHKGEHITRAHTNKYGPDDT
jgi:hypothetical protein